MTSKKISLNATQIKLIAIITMLIDHIGAVLYPNIRILRIIGRIAFPIFAYFIAEGYLKTSNVKKYMQRLFIFALISQAPFYFAFKHGYYLNVFFTLFFGLYAISVYDKTKKIRYVWLIGIITQLLNTDYGIYGVFMIYLFYKYHDDFKLMTKKQIILNLIFSGIPSIFAAIGVLSGNMPSSMFTKALLSIWTQALCVVSLVFIWMYNGERGKSIKYLFYGFYPGHLLILALIKKFMF